MSIRPSRVRSKQIRRSGGCARPIPLDRSACFAAVDEQGAGACPWWTAVSATSRTSRTPASLRLSGERSPRAAAPAGGSRSGSVTPIPRLVRGRARSGRAVPAGVRARDRVAGRPALGADGAAEERGRVGLRLLLELREPEGARARGEPARGALLLLARPRTAGPHRGERYASGGRRGGRVLRDSAAGLAA